MKAFVKSLYRSQTPTERLREIDRRMWEKYGKFMGHVIFEIGRLIVGSPKRAIPVVNASCGEGV
jgi:hypothetical protein